MSRFFAFAIILSGVLIGYVICPNPPESKNAAEPETNQPATDVVEDSGKTKSPYIDEDRWTLKNFDKNVINEFNKEKKEMECWDEDDAWLVCMHKNSDSFSFYWNNKKDGIMVQMTVYRHGDIEQLWSFENFDVKITIDRNSRSGIQKESWKWPESSFWIQKSDDGVFNDSTWDGPEDFQSLEKYKLFIAAWCAHNVFFVGKSNCLIYWARKSWTQFP